MYVCSGSLDGYVSNYPVLEWEFPLRNGVVAHVHRVLVISGVHVCAPIALPEEVERTGKGAYPSPIRTYLLVNFPRRR